MAFNAQGLLNQLLGSGQTANRNPPRGGRGRQGGVTGLVSQLGGGGRGLGGAGGGAAAAGAIGMLLGSKRGRRMGGGLISHGGAAALGVLAYRAYNEWQARQGGAAPTGEPRTLDRVSGSDAEAQSRAVLKAVVAAAKADGHIDEHERDAIDAEFEKLSSDPEARRWLSQELSKPLDPAEVASEADSNVVASEMYLASRLVVDTENFMERSYLDELARCMKLDKDLQASLDRQAEEATTH